MFQPVKPFKGKVRGVSVRGNSVVQKNRSGSMLGSVAGIEWSVHKPVHSVVEADGCFALVKPLGDCRAAGAHALKGYLKTLSGRRLGAAPTIVRLHPSLVVVAARVGRELQILGEVVSTSKKNNFASVLGRAPGYGNHARIIFNPLSIEAIGSR